MLPNELTKTKSASFALAWSITWRVMVVVIVVGVLFEFVPAEHRFEYLIPMNIGAIFITAILLWAWIHRILKLGIGRVKIIFMEKQHYEKLIDIIDENK